MSKRLYIDYTRPSGDKIEVSTRIDPGSEREIKQELYTTRINEDGSLFFEFDRAVSLDLNAANCFVVRIR